MVKRNFKPRSKSREKTFGKRKPKYYFLIVTNGKSTEYNYFSDYSKSLPKGTVRLEPLFKHGSPSAVIKKAIDCEKAGNYDEVWAVFDKDEFADFETAVAQSSKVKSGYSNPAFELWALIHFQDVSSGIHRDVCIQKLENHLKNNDPGFRYSKSQNLSIFSLLDQYGNQDDACRRAKRMETKAGSQPWKTNPTTSIHTLIERISEELGNC